MNKTVVSRMNFTGAAFSILLSTFVGGFVTACAAEEVPTEQVPAVVAVPAKADESEGKHPAIQGKVEDSKVEPARFRVDPCGTCPPSDPLCCN